MSQGQACQREEDDIRGGEVEEGQEKDEDEEGKEDEDNEEVKGEEKFSLTFLQSFCFLLPVIITSPIGPTASRSTRELRNPFSSSPSVALEVPSEREDRELELPRSLCPELVSN